MTRALVGTYAAGGGAGLVQLARGDERAWRVLAAVPVTNASFVLTSARSGHHYAVDEVAGTIAVYSAAGGWALLAEVPSGGEAPCHLALSADERFLAVANYASGSVMLLALDARGLPAGDDVYVYAGSGPNRERQESPHAHWVGFSPSGELIAVDLGADRVVVHAVEERGALSPPRKLYAAPPGSGPRHLAFHPTLPIGYLVSELVPELTVLAPGVDGLVAVHREPLLDPAEASGDALGGAIVLSADAQRLYVTTRGTDRLLTFALDARGLPTLLARVPSGGASPRHLLPLDGQLLVAHEQDGTVAIFDLDEGGRAAGTPQRLNVPGAAFLATDRERR
ncbi:beta-propeller fold lactonase family protein [Sphingomonas sp. BK580]|uniref:lactonase family protein n=1 Tax=Sphingomonas sp. BK580 TaxID=2586972 RepID=UPI00161977A9|nr:beta-propeller fold lactonase family protein [Sphingomonas sp. BK580]MBB3692163.1 6-phosphogluconolactonase [Sphingomonas sp. BK580]